MKRTEIKKLFTAVQEYTSAPVTVCGWAKTIRDSKSIGFIELNDGSSFQNLQVVLEAGKLENFSEVVKLNVGSALVVRGSILLTPDAKQPWRLKGLPLRTIRSRRSAIRLNSCVRSRICVRAPIPLQQCSGCGRSRRTQSISFSTNAVSFMCIPR